VKALYILKTVLAAVAWKKLGFPGLFLVLFAAPLIAVFAPDPKGPTHTPAPAPVSAPDVQNALAPTGAYAFGPRDGERASWTWNRAKDLAAEVWESQLPGDGAYTSFYCGCRIDRTTRTGGSVDFASCGYEPRRNQSRASRLEWEHIVPASVIGQGRQCWAEGHSQCVNTRGEPFRGRDCCMRVDPEFVLAATDPVNLAPAVGEVNGDRSNRRFGQIEGEARAYGYCPVEIDFAADVIEPPENRKGDIARVWAYMSNAYGIPLDPTTARLYTDWIAADPVSNEEILINRAIQGAGHRPNHFVLGSN